jgi:hypothetical protein
MRSLKEIAERLIWWTSPERAIENKVRFIAQVMVYGDLEDTKTLLKEFNCNELQSVLETPPPGVFTPPAWHYWHIVLDKRVTPLEIKNRRRIP